MAQTEFKWMPHHEGAIPPSGQGERISTYNVALEGWRRGLKLEFYSVFEEETKQKLRYSLSNGERTHHFQLSMGDKVTQEAFDICADKDLTKQYLSKAGVPVPEGRVFTKESSIDEIGDFADSLGYPVVLKPTDGNAGKGVFANVQSRDELLDLVKHVQKDLGFNHIIVENFVQGNEWRIVVIEDRVLGAMIRRPASVLGDGKHTISQLIKKTNDLRRANPHMPSRLIRADREVINLLHRLGYTLKTVPERGQRVFLRTKSNLSGGGDSIDVTEKLTPELAQIAIDAGKAIPGLPHFGVDMIVDEERNTGTILEVNTRPGLGGHMFPIVGKPRDLASDIIEYYFPETKKVERSPLFFDFDAIVELIMSRQVSTLEVKSTSTGPFYGREIIVSGKVQWVGFRAWTREQALERDLHGTVENLKGGQVRIRVMGTDQVKLDDFEAACHIGPTRAKVEDVKVSKWYKPVQIGFKIIGKSDEPTNAKKIQQLATERERIKREKASVLEQFGLLQNRRTWKYMESLKRLGKKIL